MTKTEAKTEETAVVPRDNGAGGLTVPSAGAAGLSGEFGQSDITLPICSLVQPMSQEKGDEGRFWFPDGRSLDGMTTVVLDIVATRALWAPIGEGMNGPLCRSGNRKEGLTNFPGRVLEGDLPPNMKPEEQAYIPCETCPHFADATTFEAGDKSPRCRYGYTLLMYETEQEFPFLFFVKGMAVKPVKMRIVSPALMRYKRAGLAEPWANGFEWTAHKVEQPGRKYWVPDIAPLDAFDADGRAYYAALSAELSGRASAQSFEDEPPPPDDDVTQGSLVE
jgi:hypothetical protein